MQDFQNLLTILYVLDPQSLSLQKKMHNYLYEPVLLISELRESARALRCEIDRLKKSPWARPSSIDAKLLAYSRLRRARWRLKEGLLPEPEPEPDPIRNLEHQEITASINVLTGFFLEMLKEAPDGDISRLHPAWFRQLDLLRSCVLEANASYTAANQPVSEIQVQLFHEAVDSFHSVLGSWKSHQPPVVTTGVSS